MPSPPSRSKEPTEHPAAWLSEKRLIKNRQLKKKSAPGIGALWQS